MAGGGGGVGGGAGGGWGGGTRRGEEEELYLYKDEFRVESDRLALPIVDMDKWLSHLVMHTHTHTHTHTHC